jgi:hypothetical protein
MDCLDGRIANERFFPDFIYAGKTHTRILASWSMIQAGDDIRHRCRETLQIIKQHYMRRIGEHSQNAVLGDPETICRELEAFDEVNDVAAAFVTPQRGLNPVYVAALLEAEIRRLGIEFRQECEVISLAKQASGKIAVQTLSRSGHHEVLHVDQISIAAAGRGLYLSKKLNPNLSLPRIYFALRQISFVHMPMGSRKTYTCLKLEDQYGGMLSPLNQHCAMIYHPPAAHIEVAEMDPENGEMPLSFLHSLDNGYDELEQRAQQTLCALKRFYQELRHAELLGSYLKIAINTVDISRVRRRMPAFQVIPGCTLMILPKWTMAVVNAREDLQLALECSAQRGRLPETQKKALLQQVFEHSLPVPEIWKTNFASFLEVARQHSNNMHLPASIIQPMDITTIRSLQA